MSFVNSIKTIMAGFGNPLQNDTQQVRTAVAVTTAASPVAIVIPSTGSLSPTISRGKIRVKVYAGATAVGTVLVTTITATDGTSTVTVYNGTGLTGVALSTTVAGTALDQTFEFCTDINATSFAVNVTMTGSTATGSVDVEVSGS